MEDFNDQQKELVDIIERNAKAREQERQKQRLEIMNEEEIKEGLKIPITAFWCDRCKVDYNDYKLTPIVESDWVKDEYQIAYWKSRHKCGAWNRRYITDKKYDPYWVRSKKMKKDRGNYYRDMLQPSDSGFDMLYKSKSQGY